MTLSPSDVFAESSFFIRPPKKNPRRSKRRSEKSAGSLKMVFLFDVWEHHINDIKTFVRENVLTVFLEQCFDFRLCSVQRDNVIKFKKDLFLTEQERLDNCALCVCRASFRSIVLPRSSTMS